MGIMMFSLLNPLDLWEPRPFEPTLKNGHVSARGWADNKGQLLPHLFGVEQEIEVGIYWHIVMIRSGYPKHS
jgi:acetylornithine deacetylase/succinyl-diaminopimelate desuccinylase-like protein